MKISLCSACVILVTAATGLSGCKRDADSATGLTGTWKLVSREECFCAPGPTPNETAAFTATGFSFTRNGQIFDQGKYVQDRVPKCGTTAPVPVLRLTTGTSSGQMPRNVAFTLNGNQLVLDYRNFCISDQPVDTYQRLP
ncbi:hypothetical protein [Hymenobacter sp.]|uniref:hypothetical protein n=1 Tax=Hymenobacter sp. TaxID=1898978 RepID=UPI00286C63B0|nr:hypothetical protein [Hymenobacter sp.]